jgi:ATP-dependent Clp protease ATP-binding subunit ClpC
MAVEQQLQELVERARSGDIEPYEELLATLRRQGRTDSASLVALARSEEPILRRAALHLIGDDADEDLLAALGSLAYDSASIVRQALAEVLADHGWWPLDHIVATLMTDSDSDVRQAAIRAARWRPALEPRLVERLTADDYWRARQEISRVLAHFTPRTVAPVLLRVLAEDGDSDVQAECASSLEKLLQAMGGYPAELPRPSLSLLKEAHGRVTRLRAGLCPQLLAWLQERVDYDVDIEELKKFGTLLTLEAQAGQLPHAYEVDALIDDVFKVLSGKAPRAVVVVGEAGAGKTAIICELTHRLAPEGWQVLRVAPSDFLAGTVYLGEWETKLRNLITAAKHPRKVILYVPNLEELASVGVTSKSDMNVATALAPHIERGDVAIIGESTAESFRKGLGAIRSLRRLFHAVQVPSTDDEETRDILRAVAEEAGMEVPDGVLDRLLELADFYSSGTAQPGRSVGLLRRVLGVASLTPPPQEGKAVKGPISERQVLQTISTSTGIPVDFLDDSVSMDRTKVRAHFESRVMGQPEAVEAVVDLVTLVKAGLTDPNKPFGVMLFVGPTGVGKTELARALAELLFGDPGKMVRLDMSEYATYEAYERLIGQGLNPGLLTATVRERPFAVLLFDEIEKAHFNVFDLCLQIFDAGRLTDAQGRTADFRRTIIILTSNVGSRIATEAPVGFGRSIPPAPDTAVTMRELARSFRPEFLNRIDRVVQFRPLSAETAEKIARREVERVLERSGIARRKLVVDVEPSLLPLLLREGYSPAYGARPLKRTVERMVLLPVARAIASGEATAGSLLRLMARGNRVEVEVSPPESAESVPAEPVPSPRAASIFAQAQRLRKSLTSMRERAAPLSSRKSNLLEMLAAPGAWDDRRSAESRSDEVFRIDGLLAALGRLDQELRRIEERLERRPSDRELARLEEQLDALEGRSRHAGVLVACRDPRELGDAFIVLSRVGPKRGDMDGVGKLGRMYQRLAERMNLEVAVLDDHRTTDPIEDVIVLQLTGAGAFALVAREQGLHYFIQGRSEGTDGRKGNQREVVRVEVFPLPGLDASLGRDEVRAEVHALDGVESRLMERPRFEVHLSHQPTMTTLRVWTDRPRAEAIEQLRPLLQARLAAASQEGPSGKVVRRYTLSPSALVRDTQSGKSTGRLEEVLDGALDQFFSSTVDIEG